MAWKQTKNPDYFVCGASEFLQDEFVPQEIRDSYQQFIDSVDVTQVPVNERGWKDFDWEGIDELGRKRYSVTWNDRFKFGAMRGPIPKFYKKKGTEAPKDSEQETLDSSKETTVKLDLTATNKLLVEIKLLLETLVQVLGGPKPVAAT